MPCRGTTIFDRSIEPAVGDAVSPALVPAETSFCWTRIRPKAIQTCFIEQNGGSVAVFHCGYLQLVGGHCLVPGRQGAGRPHVCRTCRSLAAARKDKRKLILCSIWPAYRDYSWSRLSLTLASLCPELCSSPSWVSQME